MKFFTTTLIFCATSLLAFSQDNIGIGVVTPLQKVDVDGAIRIGNTSDDELGSIRYTGLDFEGYDGISWRSMTDPGVTAETDPEIGTNITNYLSKWNGSALRAARVIDNGSTINLNGNSAIDGQLDMNNNKIGSLGTPTLDTDGATKKYVDDQIGAIPAESDPIFTASPSSGITNAMVTNWNAAFGWGDHSLVGYLTTEVDPQVAMSANGRVGTWNGTSLVHGLTFDDGTGVAIGNVNPNATMDVEGDLILSTGVSVDEFSIDGTLADNSNDAVPTEQAVKTYADGQISGADDWNLSGPDLTPVSTTYNVGIGMAPSERLTVDGNILATGRFISEITNPTPPMVINSTTKVTNLNVDLLDDLNSTDFVRSDAADNVSANTEWQDNNEIRLGNGADMRMFHDGVNNVFRSDNHGSQMRFQGENAGGTLNTMLTIDPDNSVDLYYGGSNKLQTTTTGVNVTGTMNATTILAPTGTINTLGLNTGTTANEFSTDVTLGGSSNNAISTENAIKTYVDNAIAVGGADNLGNHTATTTLNMVNNNFTNTNIVSTRATLDYDKLRVYSSSNYTIGMISSTFGALNDLAMSFTFNQDDDRGFVYRDESDATNDGAMSLTTNGRLTVKSTTTLQSLAGTGNRMVVADASGNLSTAPINVGDITGVTAGDGLTGGATSGSTTVNLVATNGLTDAANDVRLGGTLIQTTGVTLSSYDMYFNLNSTGDFEVRDNGTTHFEVRDNGYTYFGDDTYWRDANVDGTNLARIYDSGDDGVFQVYSNAAIQHSINSVGTTVFNEQSVDRDFKIESNNQANMFYVNGGTDRIGVATSGPGQRLSAFVNTDNSAEFGRAHIGYTGYSDWAAFTHVDMNAAGNYSIMQNGSGLTLINANAGQYIGFRIENVQQAEIESDGDFELLLDNQIKMPNNQVFVEDYSAWSYDDNGSALWITATSYTGWIRVEGSSSVVLNATFNYELNGGSGGDEAQFRFLADGTSGCGDGAGNGSGQLQDTEVFRNDWMRYAHNNVFNFYCTGQYRFALQVYTGQNDDRQYIDDCIITARRF